MGEEGYRGPRPKDIEAGTENGGFTEGMSVAGDAGVSEKLVVPFGLGVVSGVGNPASETEEMRR